MLPSAADESGGDMTDPWADAASGWDDHEMTRAYADAALGSLVVILDQRQRSLARADVCDFGCGTGLLTERLVAVVRSVTAVDSSPAMLAQLQAKVDEHGWPNVTLASSLPEAEERYDLVVCSSVLGFVEDYPGMVRELVSHLRPGALLVHWDWERDDSDADPHGLTSTEIETALLDAGCIDVHVGIGFEKSIGDTTMRPLIGVGQRPEASTA